MSCNASALLPAFHSCQVPKKASIKIIRAIAIPSMYSFAKNEKKTAIASKKIIGSFSCSKNIPTGPFFLTLGSSLYPSRFKRSFASDEVKPFSWDLNSFMISSESILYLGRDC